MSEEQKWAEVPKMRLVDEIRGLRLKVESQSAELAALRGALEAAQRLADWSNIGWREFEAKYGKKWTQEKMIDAVAESLASIPAPAAEPIKNAAAFFAGAPAMPEPDAEPEPCCQPCPTGRCSPSAPCVCESPAKPTAEAAREAVIQIARDHCGRTSQVCEFCAALVQLDAAEKPAEDRPCDLCLCTDGHRSGCPDEPAAPSAGKEDAK